MKTSKGTLLRRVIMASAILSLVLLSGCSTFDGMGDELSACMEKCSKVCSVVKESGYDMGDYSIIGLKKISGATTVSCECSC